MSVGWAKSPFALGCTTKTSQAILPTLQKGADPSSADQATAAHACHFVDHLIDGGVDFLDQVLHFLVVADRSVSGNARLFLLQILAKARDHDLQGVGLDAGLYGAEHSALDVR